MPTPLSLDTARSGDGTLVLRASGELDLSNIDLFQRALDESVSTKADGAVTVDLSKVEYLDSGAINVLFGYTDQIQLIANPVLIPVLKISGLADEVVVDTGS